jgi:hypothetical protein
MDGRALSGLAVARLCNRRGTSIMAARSRTGRRPLPAADRVEQGTGRPLDQMENGHARAGQSGIWRDYNEGARGPALGTNGGPTKGLKRGHER